MKTMTDVILCPACGAQPRLYTGAEWMENSRATVPHVGIPPSFFIVGCIGPGHATYSGSRATREDALDCWNKMAR